jgi:hypothetical protein
MNNSYEARLAAAKDPATHTACLQELSLDEDLEVKRQVTLNPNTPVEALLRLGQVFSVEFAQNPSLQLFLLEDPSFLQKLPWRLLNELTSAAQLPDFLIEAFCASSYEKIQEKMASHPKLPAEHLERFLLCENRNIRKRAAANPNTSSTLLLTLRAMGSNESLTDVEDEYLTDDVTLLREFANKGFWAKLLVARNPNTPADVLDALFLDESYQVRAQVVANSNTHSETVARALRDPEEAVISAAMMNKKLPPSALEVLMERQIPQLWNLVASRQDTPASLLKRLIEAKTSPYRRAVVAHSNITQEILDILSHDEDPELRALVAVHAETSLVCLQRLAKDSVARVRRAVAKNAKITKELIELLKQDPNEFVSRAAQKTEDKQNPPFRYTPKKKLKNKSKPRQKLITSEDDDGS